MGPAVGRCVTGQTTRGAQGIGIRRAPGGDGVQSKGQGGGGWMGGWCACVNGVGMMVCDVCDVAETLMSALGVGWVNVVVVVVLVE